MNPNVEIFSQGEEVVTGQVADTNAAWLSVQLVEMGFNVSRHTAVGDNLNNLVKLLEEISQRADCCICTGGLGPTVDDLTRAAVAKAFDAPLFFDEIALENISHFFNKREMRMADVNRQQAMFPQGAIRIDNDWGTAPAFSFKTEQCLFIFLPGVPFEMQQLFIHKVKATLQRAFVLQPQQLVTLKTFGMGESDLQSRLHDIELPATVNLGFKAGIDENQVKLLFAPDYPNTEKITLVEKISNHLGDVVFAIDGLNHKAGGLFEIVAEFLENSKQTLALLETASCGLIAAKCVGKSWLMEANVCPDFEAIKKKYWITDESDMFESIDILVNIIQKQSGADFVLIQLYNEEQAALTNQDETIFLYNILWTRQHRLYQQHTTLNGDLQRKQHKAAMLGLDLLRRYLQQKTL